MEDQPPAEHESESEMIEKLERRGFQVFITRHVTSKPPALYCCRLRNAHIDQSYYGDTARLAIINAIETVRMNSE